MRKSLVVLAALIALAGAGTALWFFAQPEPEAEVHRLAVRESAREIGFLPHYVAAALGYFEAYDLHLVLSTAPRGVLDLKHETADMFLVSLDRLMVDGPVAFVGLTQREPNLLLGREAASDFTWERLKGEIIVGNPPDTAGEVALEEVLRRHEMIPQTDVTIIQHLPVHLRVGTFLAGTGGYIILPDPSAAYLEKSGTAHVLASLAESGMVPARVCAATPEFLRNHPDAALNYALAVMRAQGWIAGHDPREIAVVVAPFFPDLDLETLIRMIARNKEAGIWATTPLIEEEHYRTLQEWLVRSGEIPEPIPYNRVVEPSFAWEALEQSGPPLE